MDALITSAARALARGDALGALKRVALREDPPALALRGIAMAQLGEHHGARELLRRAARGFGKHEALAQARCLVAEAEVALAMRDLGGAAHAVPSLAAATAVLRARGDRANELQAHLIAARRFLLLGRLDEAAAILERLDARGMPPALTSMAEMAKAELALRSLRMGAARAALALAQQAAEAAHVPALAAEVREARAVLDRPAARRLGAQGEQTLRLDEVADLLASDALILDACRRCLGASGSWLPLAGRPVLFSIARELARAWPGDVDRGILIERAFRTRHPDDTHRARLRVEMGRLRALAAGLARIEATRSGFVLKPHEAREVVVLLPPIDGDQASLMALLSDGTAWSTSALALALNTSQRTVQRALAELHADGQVRSVGQARSRRWLAPSLAGFTTILLLPAALPPG